jgi:hypothetical protein
LLSIPEPRAAAIGGDGQQPRGERTGWIPLVEVTDRPEEHLLGNIFSVFPVREHPEAQPENGWLKPMHECRQRVPIAAETVANQITVVGHENIQSSMSNTPAASRRFQDVGRLYLWMHSRVTVRAALNACLIVKTRASICSSV